MKALEKNGSWRQARQVGLLVLAFALHSGLAKADWTLVDAESSREHDTSNVERLVRSSVRNNTWWSIQQRRDVCE